MNTPVFTFCLAGLSVFALSAQEFKVTVTAQDSPTALAIVSTPVPREFPAVGHLRGAHGKIPFQKTDTGEAVFVMRDLQPGSTGTFVVEGGEVPGAATAVKEGGHLNLKVGGKSVLTYQGQETDLPRTDIKPIFKRGGYLHPLVSPSGKVLTDDYPPNHIHHHGVWFPWTKTKFEGREPDFWNMGEGKGKVEFVSFGPNWSGPVQAGFTAQHRFIDLTSGQPKPVLNETWNVTTYSIPDADFFVVDFVSTQTCASDSPLELPKYYYGGFGFRGNWGWNGESNCSFLTASGETDRVKGNETRANWCHVGGSVDGSFTGVALLGHPDNFRAPQPMRLHPKEPFFCFAPSQLGDWAIEPGKPYVSKYRLVVKDGLPDKEQIEALWQSYAHPPQVKVSRN